ncbi:hypothetical protein PENTCL1PPCAC_24132, partial [Pristionchus entomophagus]
CTVPQSLRPKKSAAESRGELHQVASCIRPLQMAALILACSRDSISTSSGTYSSFFLSSLPLSQSLLLLSFILLFLHESELIRRRDIDSCTNLDRNGSSGNR